MAESSQGARFGWPMAAWNPPARKTASLVVLIATVLLVGAGAALLFLAPGVAATYLWVALALVAAAFLVQLAVVASGVAAEGGGPGWVASMFGAARGPRPARSGAAIVTHAPRHPVDLRCPECDNVFTVDDTGERPLRTTCAHCGAEGLVDLPPLGEEAAEAALPAPAPTMAPPAGTSNPVLTLKCPACRTQFSVEDDGTRPLKAVCPGCGRTGRLR